MKTIAWNIVFWWGYINYTIIANVDKENLIKIIKRLKIILYNGIIIVMSLNKS